MEPHVVGDAGRRAADWPANWTRRPARRCWGRASKRWRGELAGKQLEKVYAVEHELLKEYTPDGYTAALRQLVAQVKPEYVLFPHTYQVRDFLPKLATRSDTVAVSDVVAHRVEDGAAGAGAPAVPGQGERGCRGSRATAPHFASLQAGAYRADQLAAGSAPVEKFAPQTRGRR